MRYLFAVAFVPFVTFSAFVTASAQMGMGIDFAPPMEEKEKPKETPEPLPYAVALEMEFSSATWKTVALSTAGPAAEFTSLLYRGYYKSELVELVLMAERAGVPFKEVFRKREKGESLDDIAKSYKLDPDEIHAEAVKRRRHLETDLLPGVGVSTVSVSTRPASLTQPKAKP